MIVICNLILIQVIFDFANDIDKELESSLQEIFNIEVRINGKPQQLDTENKTDQNIKKLNLDVTTLMSCVSSLTCEPCKVTFDQPILMDQVRREALRPTKLILDKLFEGMLK